MLQKAKPSAALFLPKAFVSKEELFRFLSLVESGADYLDQIVGDDTEGLLTQAVMNYSQIVSSEVDGIRKMLGEWPALLNKEHPACAEMYNAVVQIAEEAQHRHTQSLNSDRPNTKAAPKSRPGKASAN